MVLQYLLWDEKPIRVKTRKQRKERHHVATFIHLGAGVQSSCLVEMYLEGALDLPRLDGVIFADTLDEPQWVYEQVDYLTTRLASAGIALTVIRASERGLIGEITKQGGRFASMPMFTKSPTGKVSMLKRQCTRDFKIDPGQGVVKDWLVSHGYAQLVTDKNGQQYRRVNRDVYVNAIFGISLDEFERTCSSDYNPDWLRADYPLIYPLRMRRGDCIQWLQDQGLPVPKKSSCRVCPFHDDSYWLDLSQNYPADFAHACRFDDWLRSPEGRNRQGLKQDVFLHRSAQPLREIDFAERLKMPLLDAPRFSCVNCST